MASFGSSISRVCSICRHLHSTLSLRYASARSKTLLFGKSSFENDAHFVPRASFSWSRLLHQSQPPTDTKEDLLTDFDVSYDEFKHVEAILPKEIIPEIPQHESYPTPSGWFPPDKDVQSQYPYSVGRTKNGMLPLYTKTERVYKHAYHIVHIARIEGDIWALERDLKSHLESQLGSKVKIQVNEVRRQIQIRGLHTDLVAEFLFQRGN